MFDQLTEPRTAGNHFAAYVTGDVLDVLERIPDRSIDLVMTSPPFLALRSYLPDDHPQKADEIGAEATPADFLDTLIDVVEGIDRVLAPHGSICFELGDTYSGSGGAGGDYNEGGLRDGQARFDGSASRAYGTGRSSRPPRVNRGGMGGRPSMVEKATGGHHAGGAGWPLAKSLTGIPTLFAWSLAYGRNLLRPERETAPWRIRNVVAWVRPNPPVGALGDKFRPATSYLTVATRAADRYFDLDAVRHPNPRADEASRTRAQMNRGAPGYHTGESSENAAQNPHGAPPLDWWEISPTGYRGSHYAVFPPELCVKPVKAMCPERVCTVCGEPSRRLVETTNAVGRAVGRRAWMAGTDGIGSGHSGEITMEANDRSVPDNAERVTLGWSDCCCGPNCRPAVYEEVEYPETRRDDGKVIATGGTETVMVDAGECDGSHWRPGVVLDPFAGTFTTGLVAHGHGRSAIGIDLDERNADLARERLGMFLEIYGEPASRPVETVETEVL